MKQWRDRSPAREDLRNAHQLQRLNESNAGQNWQEEDMRSYISRGVRAGSSVSESEPEMSEQQLAMRKAERLRDSREARDAIQRRAEGKDYEDEVFRNSERNGHAAGEQSSAFGGMRDGKERSGFTHGALFTPRDVRRSGLNTFGSIPHNFSLRPDRESFYPIEQSTQRRNDGGERGGSTPEGSRSSRPRQGKIEAFPKDVKPSDKLFQWNFWLRQFKMAMEKGGVTSQRAKAVELSLTVGQEINMIIMTRDLLPEESEVRPGFRFFDFLVEGVTSVLSKLTDASTNAREFRSLKQGENETVPEFALRTEKAAQKIGLTNATLLSTAFIDGLRDSEVRGWATAFNLSMDEAMDAAIRRENGQKPSLPWEVNPSAPIAVAAVEKPQTRNEETSAKHEKRSWRRSPVKMVGGRRFDHAPPYKREGRDGQSRQSSSRQAGGQRCPKCNRDAHVGRQCPADSKQCYNCKEFGHFEATCKIRRVNNVDKHERNSEVSGKPYY